MWYTKAMFSAMLHGITSPLLVLGCFALACSANQDPAVSSAIPSTICFDSASALPCAQALPRSAGTFPPPETLLADLALSEGKVVALGEGAALVRRATAGETTWSLVPLVFGSQQEFPIDTSPLGTSAEVFDVFRTDTGFDVANNGSTSPPNAFALGCAGATCRVFAANLSENSSLTLLDSVGELPVAASRLLPGPNNALCALGAGLACFREGAWQTELSADQAPELVNAFLVLPELTAQSPSAALGADGDLWVDRGDGWFAAGQVADSAVLGATRQGNLLQVITADGSWLQVNLETLENGPANTESCQQAPNLVAITEGSRTVLTETGQVFRQYSLVPLRSPAPAALAVPPNDATLWCLQGTLPQRPTVLDSTSSPCGVTPNPIVLTDNGPVGLLGPLNCAIP